jgi:acyl-coenzyme A thioesterase PaaI-like protein
MSMFLKSLKELPPFGMAVGMRLDETDSGPGIVVLLDGDPNIGSQDFGGSFHNGVILATIDNAAGWCIRDHADYREGIAMATLDLRVDFLSYAALSETLRIRACCEGIDRDLAFVRASAEIVSTGQLVALGQATFMMGTSPGPHASVAQKPA